MYAYSKSNCTYTRLELKKVRNTNVIFTSTFLLFHRNMQYTISALSWSLSSDIINFNTDNVSTIIVSFLADTSIVCTICQLSRQTLFHSIFEYNKINKLLCNRFICLDGDGDDGRRGDTYGTMTVIGGRLSHRRLVRKIDAIMAGLVDRRNQDAILLQLPLLQNQTKNQSKSQSPPRFFFLHFIYLYLVFLVYHHPPKT